MTPLVFRWNGDNLVPLRPKECGKELVIGRVYRVEDEADTNRIRGHEFAFLQEAWSQLPHDLVEKYPSVHALRKAGLIFTGFSKITTINAGTSEVAQKIAAIWQSDDEFAVVVVDRTIVTRVVAMSQAEPSRGGDMDIATLKESRWALINWVAGLIGVDPHTLDREAGRAA